MNKQKLIISLCAAGAVLLGLVGFMLGKSMGSEAGSQSQGMPAEVKKETIWTCSMHPQIKLNKPGKCPICGMDLIPLKPGESLGEREIMLSPLAEKLADIEVMPAVRKDFYMTVPMVGKISLDETRSKKITSRYAGRLDRLYVDYAGVEVKKGDHLFEIYSPALITAQEELAQAIESAKAMQKSSVKAIRESSIKAVEASRDKLRLWGLTDEQIKKFEETKIITDHVTTYSPMEGVVVKKHVDEGAYVKEGSVVYSIASLDYLWVELDAYESDLQWLHYAQDVSFTTEAYPGEEFHGRISFINPMLNDKTRTVKVRVNVENKDRRLKPEMFVRAEVRVNINAAGKVIDNSLSGKWISPMHPEVISDKPGPCTVCGMPLVPAEEYGFASEKTDTEKPLVIPSTAPLITGKRAVVYVKAISKEGVYEGRTITLGLKAGDYYVVKSGLREGELVVIKGAFKIDSALQIQAKPSMMSLKDTKEKSQISVSDEFKKSLSAVYGSYDEISKNLSKDSIAGIKALTEKMKAAVKAVSSENESVEAKEFWEKKSRDINLTLNVIKSSQKIDQARKHFETLSVITIELVHTFGTVVDINLAYCPMAFNDRGAYWLQKADEVENPYFGSQMFHCGDIKKKFTKDADKKETEKPHEHHEKKETEKPHEHHEKKETEKPHEHHEKKESKENTDSEKETDLHEHKHEQADPPKLLKTFPDGALKAYLSIHKALSSDRFPETGKDALLKGLMELAADEKTTLAAKSIFEAKKIDEVRKHFEKVSQFLISKSTEISFTDEVNIAHCPMALDGKGADWIQTGEKVENPYFGSRMYRCGTIKKKIKENR